MEGTYNQIDSIDVDPGRTPLDVDPTVELQVACCGVDGNGRSNGRWNKKVWGANGCGLNIVRQIVTASNVFVTVNGWIGNGWGAKGGGTKFMLGVKDDGSLIGCTIDCCTDGCGLFVS